MVFTKIILWSASIYVKSFHRSFKMGSKDPVLTSSRSGPKIISFRLKQPDQRAAMDSIGNILQRALRPHRLRKRMLEGLVFERWRDITGETLYRNARPEFVRQGTLFVRVSDPIWMQELQAHKGLLIRNIEKEAGKGVISEIRFRIGPVEKADGSRQASLSGSRSKRRLKAEDRRRVEDAVSDIKDQALRKVLKRLFERSLKE